MGYICRVLTSTRGGAGRRPVQVVSVTWIINHLARLDGNGALGHGPGPGHGGSRERQCKRRPAAQVVGGAELAAVLFEDRAADGQAHPQPVGLGGDERLEETVSDVGGDAGSAVV